MHDDSLKQPFTTTYRIPLVICVCGYLGACIGIATHENQAEEKRAARGLLFPHPIHMEDGIACTDCHDFESEEPMALDHEMCGLCHEIPEEDPTQEACGFCHTTEDYSVAPKTPFLSAERRFDHMAHIRNEIECATCHENPDLAAYPEAPVMPFCMDCHAKQDIRASLDAQLASHDDSTAGNAQPGRSLNDCSVCHNELDVDTVPKFRDGVRIAHDAPGVWTRLHGREARFDPEYCATCHDAGRSEETSCVECHRVTKPASHTVSWNRKTHGLRASWDRQSCAVCHEEETCLQCHQFSEPASHRGSFGSPLNSHCVQCHFPAQQENCTVCHEAIDHRSARPSPHLRGVYPANCSLCHPGGVPTRAPHPLNGTARCIQCHN